MIKRVAVFCGSSSGNDPVYLDHAFKTGQTIAKRGIGLVYGGTNVGLMNEVANGALSMGGEVTGVLPRFIKEKGISHEGLTDLIVVESMHERKFRMNELSDGFIALPGGFGTLEEFFEALTWGQLGLHRKPAGLLNVNGFFDPMISFVQKMTDEGFLKKANRDMLLASDNIEILLGMMQEYHPPVVSKWIVAKDNIA